MPDVLESPPHTEEADQYASSDSGLFADVPAAPSEKKRGLFDDVPQAKSKGLFDDVLVIKKEEPSTPRSQITQPDPMARAIANRQLQLESGSKFLDSPSGVGADDPMFKLGDFLIKPPEEAKGKIEAGVEEALRPALNSLTTPRNLFYMAATAGLGTGGAAARALLSGLWAGVMGVQAVKDAPRIYRELGTEMAKPEAERDKQKIAKLITESGIGTAMAVAPALHVGGEVGKALGTEPTLSAKAEAIKPVAPLTAEAVKEVAQIPEKPPAPVSPEVPVEPPKEKVEPSASTIPSDKEKPVATRPLDEGGQADRGSDVQQAAPRTPDAPAPPKAEEVISPETPVAGGTEVKQAAVSPETPSVTETTPPVPPEEMPKTPTETGFRPAVRLVGGEVVVGDAGKTHPDIIKERGLKSEDIDQRGFVSEDGQFHDREQTAQATGLPTEREEGRQHSTDLPEAQKELPATEKPAKVTPAAPETVTGRDVRTGTEMPAEAGKTVRSAASILRELSEAKAKDRSLRTRIEAAEKVGSNKQARALQSERNKVQETISRLEQEQKEKQAELTKKRLERGVRVSKSESERPWDLIDEVEAALGGKISLSRAKELIEDFKPIGAARKLFSKEGYAPDDAAKIAGGFKELSDEDFLRGLNEAANARKKFRDRASTEQKILAKEESQTVDFERQANKEALDKASVVADNLNEGDEFTLEGTKFVVEKLEFDDNAEVSFVTLKDGERFGTQQVGADRVLNIDKGSLSKTEPKVEFKPQEPPATAPKLRPGEKVGEMFQGEDQPFNLAGEKGTDADRIAVEKAKAEKTKLEAAELAAKQQQALPGTEDLPLRGMGAALAGEVYNPSSFVSNMFTAIDADRKAMGKEPMPDTKKRTWDEDNTIALNRMNRDPDWIPGLIESVLQRPRPLLSWENAGLVWQRQKWKAELNNALSRINSAYEGGLEESLAEAKIDAARFEDNLEELDRAVGRSGTGSEAGRTLQAQKMGAGDDFTLVEMRLQKRAAVGGRPLTDTESAQIQKLYDELSAAKQKYDQDLATKDQRLAEMAANLEFERLKQQTAKEPIVAPYVKVIADQVKDYFDKRADAALKRLSGKLFTISPQVLADLTDLGVSRILSGAIEFGEWSVKMAEAVGDKVKPYLQTVWESSQSALSDRIKRVAGTGPRAERVSRAVKGTDIKEERERVTAAIKEKMDNGKSKEITNLAQKLARTFVAEGVKDRDTLTDKVYDVLKTIDPEFTRRQAMDAISGYGDYKQLSKDEVSVTLRDLKRQLQEVGKLEDIMARKPPLKSGVERTPVSDEQRRLIKLVNEAKRRFGIVVTDPATQLRSALNARKTAIANQISDLEQEIATRQKIVKTKTPSPTDAELERLKKRRDELKAEHEAIFPKTPATEAERITAANRSLDREIAEVERQLKEGDVFSKGKKEPVFSPEIQAKRDKLKELKDQREGLRESIQPEQYKTPEERMLNMLKKRLENRETDLNRRIAEKDYRPRSKREIVLDTAAMESKARVDRLVKKYREGLVSDRLANRPNWEKALDWTTKIRRFDVLSSPIVIPKLLSAGAQRLASVIPEDIAGEVWRHIPGVSKIAEKAPLEGGGVNINATMTGFGAAFTRGMKAAYDVMKTGHSEIDVLYGKAAESYTGEFELGSKFLSLPGRIHGMIKAPIKQARFEDAVQRLGKYYKEQGLDVTDPMVKTRIAIDAYKAANRSIFLQDNRVASVFNAALRRAEQPLAGETTPPVGGKVLAAAGRIVFPIVRVPLNIATETFQYALGVPTAGTRILAKALGKGVDSMKPEEADLIMRELKKGSVGGALLILGYFGADSIGGYYQPHQKKREGDLKFGSIRVFDHDIPSYLLHNPLLETLQIGATIRHVADSKLRKKDADTQGLTAGTLAAALGVVEQVPFIREQIELEKFRNPYTRGQFIGEQVKSMAIPAVVQKAAEWTDRDAEGNLIKRKPGTVVESLKSGLPGLRQTVPEK